MNPGALRQFLVNPDATSSVGSYTVNMWLQYYLPAPNPTSMGNWITAGSADDGREDIYFAFRMSDKRLLVMSNKSVVHDATTHLLDGNWHMISLVRDISINWIIIYVDGVAKISFPINATQAGTFSVTPNPILGAQNFLIGNYFDANNPMQGAVDDFKFFKEAKSASEIMTIFNKEKP